MLLAVWLAVTSPGCSGGGGGADAGVADAGGDGGEVVVPEDTAALRAHVLSRAGYGPDAWSRARIAELGTDAYLEEQLDPASTADAELEAGLARSLPSLEADFHDLIAGDVEHALTPKKELLYAKLVRAIRSRRQLVQVLSDFWFDHFNVDATSNLVGLAVGPYERDAIRPHVLGRFGDMLRAVARHAAMLVYLDNFASTREGFVWEGRVRGLNENYARELLELHTLGADAGFDQQDVIEVARAFTGWTLGDAETGAADGFRFLAEAHDPGSKSILGELYLPPGRGVEDGLEVLDFLARHPKTARHVCRKLVRRFVAEREPAALVDDCAAGFLESDGDLRVVMRRLLFSREFRDPANRGGKVKRPLVFAASLARAVWTDVSGEGLARLHGFLRLHGETPYHALDPDGRPDLSEHWATGSGLVGRFVLVSEVVAASAIGERARVAPTPEMVDALAAQLLPVAPEERTREETIRRIDALTDANERRRMREAATLLLSSPDFLRH